MSLFIHKDSRHHADSSYKIFTSSKEVSPKHYVVRDFPSPRTLNIKTHFSSHIVALNTEWNTKFFLARWCLFSSESSGHTQPALLLFSLENQVWNLWGAVRFPLKSSSSLHWSLLCTRRSPQERQRAKHPGICHSGTPGCASLSTLSSAAPT